MLKLSGNLKGIGEEDRKDILYDYEEHFRAGLESGRNEEELAAALGDPISLARQMKAGYALQQAETDASTSNILRAIFAVGVLGFFNLIFILGPFIGLVGVLIGFFAAAVGISVSGIVVFFASIFQPILPDFMNFTVHPAVGIFTGAGLTSLGILFFIGVYYLAKLFYILTLKYLKLNLRLITGKVE